MTSATVRGQQKIDQPPAGSGKPSGRMRRKRSGPAGTLLAQGEPMVWLTGGALAVSLVMIIGLLGLIFWSGIGTFWPGPVVRVMLLDGKVHMGEVFRSETYPFDETSVADAAAGEAAAAEAMLNNGMLHRTLYRTGNFDITNTHFTWVADYEVTERTEPRWAAVVERFEWGRFYGTPRKFLIDGEAVVDVGDVEGTLLEEAEHEIWAQFEEHHADVMERHDRILELEKHEIGRLNNDREKARLMVRGVELRAGKDSPEYQEALDASIAANQAAQAEYDRIVAEIAELNAENNRYAIEFETAQGRSKEILLTHIARAYVPNDMSTMDKLGLYVSRWGEFLTEDPREANTEGGVFPAIFGTVLMTLIMSIAVVPFGVLAALYIREYAKAGPMISAVRIAINNLAGVPSIVFGVFGLGFFCYGVGSWIDGGPDSPWTISAWWTLLGFTIVALIAGIMLYILLLRHIETSSSTGLRMLKFGLMTVWSLAIVGCAYSVIASNPYFEGFYRARLPNPTFGKGGLMWASFTLALLTLPVVIVATEEALAAVPKSMREGSYGCGASKWQTIHRIVLPRAMPGIMTGAILAMARGAGEVAPLMLVGAVKLAPELPGEINSISPYVHVERSFMHLGFHIFDVGFHSPNSEAGKPMVYTTTLLLIVLIAALNITAIYLRGRLRRRFQGNQF